MVGVEWEKARASKSPCPTLRVISAATAIAEKIEDITNANGGEVARKRDTPTSMNDLLKNLAV